MALRFYEFTSRFFELPSNSINMKKHKNNFSEIGKRRERPKYRYIVSKNFRLDSIFAFLPFFWRYITPIIRLLIADIRIRFGVDCGGRNAGFHCKFIWREGFMRGTIEGTPMVPPRGSISVFGWNWLLLTSKAAPARDIHWDRATRRHGPS